MKVGYDLERDRLRTEMPRNASRTIKAAVVGVDRGGIIGGV